MAKNQSKPKTKLGWGKPFFLKVIKSKERSRLHLKEKETICISISYEESLCYTSWGHLSYLNRLEDKEEMRVGDPTKYKAKVHKVDL